MATDKYVLERGAVGTCSQLRPLEPWDSRPVGILPPLAGPASAELVTHAPAAHCTVCRLSLLSLHEFQDATDAAAGLRAPLRAALQHAHELVLLEGEGEALRAQHALRAAVLDGGDLLEHAMEHEHALVLSL